MRRFASGFALLLAFAAPLAADAADRGPANIPKPQASGAPWSDAERAAAAADAEAALAGAPTLRGAHVGLLAVDARDGTVLAAHGADDVFQPASTFKILVGSAALDRLTPAFRLRTTAEIVNPVTQGVLHGAVLLRGSGDVLLDDAAFATLAAALRAASIRTVEGDVEPVRTAHAPYLPGWSWDDEPWYYAAPITALGYNDHALSIRVSAGTHAGAPVSAAVTPFGSVCAARAPCAAGDGPAIVIDATTGVPGSENTIDAAREGARLIVTGSIPAGAAPVDLDLAVPDPPLYAATAARRALNAGGIATLRHRPAAPATAPRVIWSHDSEPLGDLLADAWLPSDNVLAESLLRVLGGTPAAPYGTTAAGIAAESAWLKTIGVDVSTLAIEDGSGLSTYDRVTPRALVAVLRHDWDGPYREVVLDALPVSGARGTLKNAFKGTSAERTVFAKTGSVSHVRTLAGYVATRTHGTVIFAFLIDDRIDADAAALDALRARVLSRFAEI